MKKELYILGILIVMSACADNQIHEMHPGIYILDKKQGIESFDELCGRLEGKPFYMDRWASWCSPCMEEFGHLEPLHAFLKGYHLSLNSSLYTDMAKRLIFIPIIPQYLIVGKDGEIIDKDASRPSAGEELYSQIGEAMNL